MSVNGEMSLPVDDQLETTFNEKPDSKTAQIRKVALITGITGQDGTYLAELLLSKGYEVHGITGIRRAGTFNHHHIAHLYEDPTLEVTGGKFRLHYGDLTDSSGLTNIITEIRPTEIYNLAAQSNVKESFALGEYTANVDALGPLRMLNAIRMSGLNEHVRFYQASSSELYGKVQEIPQTEKTPFYPLSPYGDAGDILHAAGEREKALKCGCLPRNAGDLTGLDTTDRDDTVSSTVTVWYKNTGAPQLSCAKLFAHWIIVNYREAYNIYACNGILFNHESPRRGEAFVTRKITQAVARIHMGRQQFMELGNLNAKRDWGHAKDYVQAMWLMMQQDEAEDYVIATGVDHTVREFIETAFKHVGTRITWEGSGVDEIGKDSETGHVRVKVNPKFYRPADVDTPLGDSTKAKLKLGWRPKYNFEMLVAEMVEHDVNLEKSHGNNAHQSHEKSAISMEKTS